MRRLLAPLLLLAACDADPTTFEPLPPISFTDISDAERVAIVKSVLDDRGIGSTTLFLADADARTAPGCPTRALERDAVVYHADQACEHPTSKIRWSGRAEVYNAGFQPMGLPYDPAQPTILFFDDLVADRAGLPFRIDGTVVGYTDNAGFSISAVSLTVAQELEIRIDATFSCDEDSCVTREAGTGWLADRGSYSFDLDTRSETPTLTFHGKGVFRIELGSVDEQGCYLYSFSEHPASERICL